MGRAVLKNLKESTLLTFFEVCKKLGMLPDVDYVYSPMNNLIKFWNGSEIYLKDLFLYPSDPEFDSLGSTEFTGAFIDEASQVTEKAKNIVLSRIRFKLDQYGIIPKLLLCSNPAKNFLYYDFYVPSKDGTMLSYRKFVPALVQDNPFISKHYVDNLQKLDKVTKERLLYGNFEYDDDPSRLMEYDKIVDLFTNKLEPSQHKYLTVDIARFGDDATVIWVWEGLRAVDCVVMKQSSTKEVRLKLEELERKHHVPRSNIIVDEDGVGGGVKDEMNGVRGFVNNSAPIQPSRKDETLNYANLKSQCYFKLADYVDAGKLAIFSDIRPEYKKAVIEELEQVKRKDADKDGKLAVVGKDKVKEILGRSPDFADALMMRMFFEVKQWVVPGIGSARIY